jgi:hypothetical protein
MSNALTSTLGTTLGSAWGSAWGGVLWYLKEATGESKWDEYVDRCEAEGVTPVSRRVFERHRAEHRERDPRSRCC